MAFGVIIQYLIRYYGYAFEKKCRGFEKKNISRLMKVLTPQNQVQTQVGIN